METFNTRVRVFDRKGEELEDRVFHRVRRALVFIEEQILLNHQLRITRERDFGLGPAMGSGRPSGSKE